jgi:hypothetical protein
MGMPRNARNRTALFNAGLLQVVGTAAYDAGCSRVRLLSLPPALSTSRGGVRSSMEQARSQVVKNAPLPC